MTRMASIVAVLLLTAGTTSYGQEVVSFSFSGTVGPDIQIATVPTGGFVLTDIIVSGNASPTISTAIQIKRSLGGEIVLSWVPSSTDLTKLHFESGIAFDSETNIFAGKNGSADPLLINLIGYIPSPEVSVPTVGEWGLVLMVMMLLIGGTTIFARRRVATA
jgi:IPTL-CTERM motif